MTSNDPFSRQSIVRIVRDLLADELATGRGRSVAEIGAAYWNESTRVDGDGLDLDSLERLNASAALNEFFHLHEYGAEDYLLSLPTIGEWCELVTQSLAATGTHLTFRTSGSTGTPKRCTHAVADLMEEVDAWASMLQPADIVLSLVPSHHIYGAIFTALLPDRLGIACEAGRSAVADSIARGSGRALAIGTPAMWAYLERSLPTFRAGLTGVSSTGPMPAGLAARLKSKGLDALIEIYGSSETGGIAYRSDPEGPYKMLDHWRRDDDGTLVRQAPDGRSARHVLMDHAEWLDDRRLLLKGRHDGAVQVGGHNVFPERVRERLLEHDGVAEAAVRFDPISGRLKAFVVAEPSEGAGPTVDQLDAWCAGVLRDCERPRHFTVGEALPRNTIGKLADW